MLKSPTCSKCNNAYAARDSNRIHRQPLLLDCGHTYCEGCLTRLAKELKSHIECPSCKHQTHISGVDGVKQLWPDVFILGQIISQQNTFLKQDLLKLGTIGQMVSSKKKGVPADKERKCNECHITKATCRCEKCDCLMCGLCFNKVHSYSNTLRQHQAAPIDHDEEDKLVMNPNCEEHGKLIEYFCEDDQTPVCSRCVVVGVHKGHSINSYEDMNKVVFAEMETALNVANKVTKRLRIADKAVVEAVPDLKKETNEVVNQIRSHFQVLHGVLQSREKELVDKVYDVAKEGVSPLYDMRTQLNEDLKNLETAIKAAQRVLNNNNEVILDAQKILSELKKAKQLPCIPATKETKEKASIKWIPGADPNQFIKQYGDVSGTVNIRLFLKPIAEVSAEDLLDDIDDNISVTSQSTTTESDSVIIEDDTGNSSDSSSVHSAQQHKSRNKKTAAKCSTGRAKIRGNCEQVSVTLIRNPREFFVQRWLDGPKMRHLSNMMNQWCNSPAAQKEIPAVVEKDDIVLGKYTFDDKWYRGRVKQVIYSKEKPDEITSIEVFYMDYGNTETIPLDRVRNMQKRFMNKFPEYSIQCSLCDIVPTDPEGAWTLDAIQTFAKMTDKLMYMVVIREENNVLYVDLSKPPCSDISDDRPVSVRDTLVFLELAKFESSCGDRPGYVTQNSIPLRSYPKNRPLTVGDNISSAVKFIGTPSQFYIQSPCMEEIQYLESLMNQMQEVYQDDCSELFSIFCPQQGMVCAAKSSNDDVWYRGIVTRLPGNKQVDVFYVDEGRSERVPYYCLRKLLDPFLRLTCQALRCTLADVASLNGDETWSNEAMEFWKLAVNEKELHVKITNIVNDTLSVILKSMTDDFFSINSELVKKGFAKSTGQSSIGSAASHKSRKSPKLTAANLISKSVQNGDEDLGSDREKNVRSRSSSSSSDSLNGTITMSDSAMTPVSSPLKGEIQQSRVNQSQRNVDVTTSSKHKNYSSLLENVKSRGTSSTTESEKKKLDVNSSAKRTQSPLSDSEDPQSPSIEVPVKICHFVAPDNFYIQIVKSCRNLERLMDNIQETYADSEDVWLKWKENSCCIVKHPEDSKWYRCKILELQDKNYIKVFMVDYGYIEVVTSSALRRITSEEISKHAAFAIKCHLANLLPAGNPDRWSGTACEYMIEMLQDKTYYVQMKDMLENNSLPIDLIYEEVYLPTALEPSMKQFFQISQDMIDKGLAIPVRRKSTKSFDKEFATIYHSQLSAEEEEIELLFPEYYYKVFETPKTDTVSVLPTYVDNDGFIFCQPQEKADIDALDSLTKKLQKYFGESEPYRKDIKWKINQACVAFYETDKTWNRGRVEEIKDEHVKVQYFDFGNSVWLKSEELRPNVTSVADIPQLCYKCCLHNVDPISNDGKWSNTVVEYIHNMIVGYACTIKVIKQEGDGPLEVDLKLSAPDSQDLASYLCEMGLCVKRNDISPLIEQSQKITFVTMHNNPFKKPILAEPEQLFPVTVTQIEIPTLVYFQHCYQQTEYETGEGCDRINMINNNLKQLEGFSVKLHENASSFPVLPRPKPGSACCAQFTADGCWYRALVIEVNEVYQQVLVVYVDYGNSEYIPKQRVRALPPDYLSLPVQAIRCNLNDVQLPPACKTWTKETLKRMLEVLNGKNLLARVVNAASPVTAEFFLPQETKDKPVLAYQALLDEGIIQLGQESQLYDQAVAGHITRKQNVSEDSAKYESEPDVIVESPITDEE